MKPDFCQVNNPVLQVLILKNLEVDVVLYCYPGFLTLQTVVLLQTKLLSPQPDSRSRLGKNKNCRVAICDQSDVLGPN